jgi:hypothetical protein
MLKAQKLFTCVYTLAEFSWAKTLPQSGGRSVGHCGSIPSSLLEGGLIVLAHAEDRESRDKNRACR